MNALANWNAFRTLGPASSVVRFGTPWTSGVARPRDPRTTARRATQRGPAKVVRAQSRSCRGITSRSSTVGWSWAAVALTARPKYRGLTAMDSRRPRGDTRAPLTSLSLAIALYFGAWWSCAFWLISISTFIYKGTSALFVLQCNRSMHHSITLADQLFNQQARRVMLRRPYASVRPQLLCSWVLLPVVLRSCGASPTVFG